MRFDLSRSVLAGTTTAQRQQWLLAAQMAYAQLMSGAKAVTVSYEGKSVSYAPTEAASLMSWIGLLQQSLGMGGRRRALRPYYR